MTRESLDGLRQKIDEIDQKLHALIQERAEVAHRIGMSKRAEGTPVVNAAREAMVMRALAARHRGDLPLVSLLAIWRELIGASSQIQSVMGVALGSNAPIAMDCTRTYFGSAAPIDVVPSPQIALSHVREGRATFAVLPWPQDSDVAPWWPLLMQDANRAMRVIARLPYDDGLSHAPVDDSERMLVVSTMPYLSSGRDHSFIVLRLAGDVSRSRINSLFDDAGLPIISVVRSKIDDLFLIEVGVYIDQEGDNRLAMIQAALGDLYGGASCIGGFARLDPA